MSIYRSINYKAIILGFLADIAASISFSLTLSLLITFILSAKGYKEAELEQTLMQVFYTKTYLLLSIVVGFLFTVMGGFIAGRIARQSEYFHAGMVGIIGVLFALFFIGQTEGFHIYAALILTIPGALSGGGMAKRKNRKVLNVSRDSTGL